MRILFIVPYPPSLIRVRAYHFVRGLAARGHRVTVAAPWVTPADRAELENVREFGCEVLTAQVSKYRSMTNCAFALASSAPLQSAYSWSPELARMIEQALIDKPFEIIHVEHLRGARYGLFALDVIKRLARGSEQRPRVVFDSVDCISNLFEQSSSRGGGIMRWLTGFDRPRTQAYEGRLVRAFDRTVATTQHETDSLARLAAATLDAPPAPVGNGVDLDYFAHRHGVRAPETIVMTGKMSYHANVAAAKYLVEEVMPIVWAERPHVRVEIVGKAPTTEVQALAYPEGRPQKRSREVLVTGEVPDLRPYLWRAAVAVAPIVYGAGVQNKVLEAMAASAPVVSSPQAVSSLGVRNGKDLLIGRTAEEMASHLLTLLANEDLRRRIGDAGRAFVEERYGWDSALATLESIYEEAMAPGNLEASEAAMERKA
ncbi:MAG: glycosyltransferase [Bryobacterales bacterium]|nr:glycosyltransferase [Bryobacterales bacterium]